MINISAIIFCYVYLASACPDPITTVHIQNHDGPIYVSPSERLPYDQQITIGNRPLNDCYGNINCPSTCVNQPSTYTTCSNQPSTYTPYSDQSPSLFHNSLPNYHTVYETDCKCVTKQLNTCVPINTVPQNTCSPGYYGCYPDYCYGYYYPEGQGSDGSCPIASDGLIPLLKTYLGQKCPKHNCQCGQSYSSY